MLEAIRLYNGQLLAGFIPREEARRAMNEPRELGQECCDKGWLLDELDDLDGGQDHYEYFTSLLG